MVLLLICYKSTFEFKLKPQFVVLFFFKFEEKAKEKRRWRKGNWNFIKIKVDMLTIYRIYIQLFLLMPNRCETCTMKIK